jgi:hypothetical protein
MRATEFITEENQLTVADRKKMINQLLAAFMDSFPDGDLEYKHNRLKNASDDELRSEIEGLNWSTSGDEEDPPHEEYFDDPDTQEADIEEPSVEYDEYDAELDGRSLAYVAQQVFNEMYPGTPIYYKKEDYISISTNKNETGAAWGMHSSKDYFLTMSLYSPEDQDEHDLVIGWAAAGEYKGVTTPILDAAFKLADKHFGKKKRVLVLDDDRSGGVWKKVAKKPGAKYVNQ